MNNPLTDKFFWKFELNAMGRICPISLKGLTDVEVKGATVAVTVFIQSFASWYLNEAHQEGTTSHILWYSDWLHNTTSAGSSIFKANHRTVSAGNSIM